MAKISFSGFFNYVPATDQHAEATRPGDAFPIRQADETDSGSNPDLINGSEHMLVEPLPHSDEKLPTFLMVILSANPLNLLNDFGSLSKPLNGDKWHGVSVKSKSS